MDQQWNSYADSPAANRQARYAPATVPSQNNGQTYTPLTPNMNLTTPSGAQTQVNPAYRNDRDGDIAMQDADPYKPRQIAKAHGHSRQQSANQLVLEESSAAARRYSPMNLSPASPYAATPQQSIQSAYSSYTPAQSRGSPTRTNSYASPPCKFHSSMLAISDTDSRL